MPPPAALLLLALLLPSAAATESETESGARGLRLETLGSLEDGRIIDTSLSRDPLQVELGKRQVIPGLEQSLLDMCVGRRGAAVRGGAGGSVAGQLLAEGGERGPAAAVPRAGAGAAGAHRVPPLPQGQQPQALQEEAEGGEEEQSQKEIKPPLGSHSCSAPALSASRGVGGDKSRERGLSAPSLVLPACPGTRLSQGVENSELRGH
uniref:peptidylprolyl isomerase n=1 Tax=Cairina moschata TaxID=8855 RepID=A0A8C3C3E3_CAIMO